MQLMYRKPEPEQLVQEKLLSAGGFPYFPQGNPGKLLCIYLCSACTVKSSVFWTPRALLSILKCCSAHRAHPDAWHTGVCVPSLHIMPVLAQHLWGPRAEPLPQVSPQMPWNPQWLPQEDFLTFLDGKKRAVGAVEVVAAWDAQSHTVQKSQIKPQWHLSSEDVGKCLWIAFS